uniref:Ribosomal protein S10 n=1 Tax=Tryblionella apiculata TaxID=1003145 RepID=A0A8F0WG80_9STRA|nr:ribosomal protein S10 [Tryblionella apiculata]QWM93468.1 ribosomal protein S10 [Tryblionella apiculata]
MINKYGKKFLELNRYLLINQKSIVPDHNKFLRLFYEFESQNVLLNLYPHGEILIHSKFVLKLVKLPFQLSLMMLYLKYP